MWLYVMSFLKQIYKISLIAYLNYLNIKILF